MLPDVDWEKQVAAGVDEHADASYYFKKLMKKTKKDMQKNAQNKTTPTNKSQRPRLGSYESAVSS